MLNWITLCLAAAMMWGVVGLLQKLATNRLSASSLLLWVTVGFAGTAPIFLFFGGDSAMLPADIALGMLSGGLNALGCWFLFASLEAGAKASVAVPLTALYPLVTVVLAVTLLGEALSPMQAGGVALALVAGALLSFEPNEEAETVQGAPPATGLQTDRVEQQP